MPICPLRLLGFGCGFKISVSLRRIILERVEVARFDFPAIPPTAGAGETFLLRGCEQTRCRIVAFRNVSRVSQRTLIESKLDQGGEEKRCTFGAVHGEGERDVTRGKFCCLGPHLSLFFLSS